MSKRNACFRSILAIAAAPLVFGGVGAAQAQTAEQAIAYRKGVMQV